MIKAKNTTANRSNRQVLDRVAEAASSSSTTGPRAFGKSGRVVPGSVGPSTSAFPSLSTSGSTPSARPTQNTTPWLSSSGNMSSAPPPVRPYSVPAPPSEDTNGKKGKKVPATTSTSLFPELPASTRVSVPKGSVGGNQSLRKIVGDTSNSNANPWGSSKNGGTSENANETGNDHSNGGGSGKGKKKKAKETLFTLGSFPS